MRHSIVQPDTVSEQPANGLLRPIAGSRYLQVVDRRTAINAATTALLLLTLAVMLFTALRTPLKDDIAWLLYVARRWMAGRELYVDVIEVNPPLIVWISAIPIHIAGWLRVQPEVVAMPFFMSAILGSAFATACTLRDYIGRVDGFHHRSLFADRLPVFAILGTVLLVVPGMELGQREHLLIAAGLPYLVLFARGLDGHRPRPSLAIAVGIVAALGCALKPRYAAAFAVLECLTLLRGQTVFRLMPMAAATALAAYAGLVFLISPSYYSRAIPLALALYGVSDVTFLHLLFDSLRLLACQGAALMLWGWSRQFLPRSFLPERSLVLTLVVFSLAATVVCFLDGKVWFYHRLPATIATILALLVWITSAIANRRQAPAGRARHILLPMLVAVAAIATFAVTTFQRVKPEIESAVQPERTITAHLEDVVRRYKVRRYIAFSEWIALGFPVVNNTGVTWTSRFDSMWALKGELWRVRFDPTAEREYPVRRWVARDFVQGCPDLAVVDLRDGFNYIAVLSASDPEFARAWAGYRRIEAFDGLEVYLRHGKCSPEAHTP